MVEVQVGLQLVAYTIFHAGMCSSPAGHLQEDLPVLTLECQFSAQVSQVGLTTQALLFWFVCVECACAM